MRGQNLRLALRGTNEASKKYIAGALSFDLDYQSDTEENTTKDSTGGFKEFEPTLKSWSGSGQCRLAKDASDTAALHGWDIADLVGLEFEASFDETDGEKNRVTVTPRKKGVVIITGWKISAAAGSIVNADFTFQGRGQLYDAALPTTPGTAVVSDPTASVAGTTATMQGTVSGTTATIQGSVIF